MRVLVDGGTNNFHYLVHGCSQLTQTNCVPSFAQGSAPKNYEQPPSTNLSVSRSSSDSDGLYQSSMTDGNHRVRTGAGVVNCGRSKTDTWDVSAVNIINGRSTVPCIGDCVYKDLPLPDFISGDFDSVEPQLLEYYAKRNVKICPTPDQSQTDFTKALVLLNKFLADNSKEVSYDYNMFNCIFVHFICL